MNTADDKAGMRAVVDKLAADVGFGNRVALCRLATYPSDFRWIARCPYCKREHMHSAGPLDGDPRMTLGQLRTPHCHSGPAYRLVEVPKEMRRFRLPSLFNLDAPF